MPITGKLSKSEAITKLTQIYFASRGPATLKDFIWWSGLSLGDAKIGIAESGTQLEHFTFNNLKYYHFKIDHNIPQKSTFALLPCYDEYTVGYSKGRDIILPTDVDNSKIGYGIFKPIILSGNEIAGIWRKVKKSPFIEIETFPGNKEIPRMIVKKHIRKFNVFHG